MQLPGRLKGTKRGRMERFNIVVAILLAGWVPSILMLVVSYTILTNTLESKILRDRQTFVQLTAHLVADDLANTSATIEYYQTLPTFAKVFTVPNRETAAQQWLNDTYFSHPRIDGMFLTDEEGRLIAGVPSTPEMIAQDFSSELWREGARSATGVYVSPIHPRQPDTRIATDIVGAVRNPDGNVVGFLGVSVLVERIGRRLSAIEFADHSTCQVLDQRGAALFEKDFKPKTGAVSPEDESLIKEIRLSKTGHLERSGNLYSFSPVESTGWTTVLAQPRAVAYRPVRDLLGKTTFLVAWLLGLTAVGAGLAGKSYRRQTEAARRLQREVIFNEKILANMPSGIALVDPTSRNFLQANEAFTEMAQRFGQLPAGTDIQNATFEEVKIAPAESLEKVLSFGVPFQLIEQPFKDLGGTTRFVNINLLRLQDAQQTIQGVLYLVEDKTRDVTFRQELIRANAAKDQFLALLSHELRNPLTPVIAMVGELEASASQSPQTRQALEVIRRNVELEARLIDDLLDVTRIAKGKLQLTFETVCVHQILQRAHEICLEEINARKQKVEFNLRAQRSFVSGDPARLQQIFWNVIKNSVKFTPEGGQIRIETTNPSAETIEIAIIDAGIGIEKEKLDRVFNAFEQGQSSITRRFGGLGLGLAISKAMVDAHDGAIHVQSGGKDQGSTFTVRLKTVPAPALSDNERPAPRPSSPGKSGNGEQPLTRVLVVDDHRDTCIGMKMMLERRGYQITLAYSADQAVEKAGEESFDLLISDIGLPDRSGYELMRELRASKGLRGIALSGFGMEDDVKRAREAGFSEHLTKPINFDRLEEAIRNLLSEKQTCDS
jgi:signal transduction histidine kinase/ActR/RegA family two-component response regulator